MSEQPQDEADAGCEKPARPQNPFEHASFISKLFFLWPYPLLKLGMKRPLEPDDIPHIMSVDGSGRNREYLDRLWKAEKRRRPNKPSLSRAIFMDFISSIWYIQPIFLVESTAKVFQALALGHLVQSFESDNNQGYYWAGALVLCVGIILFMHHYEFFIAWRKGMQIRTACVAGIYDKTLRLSSTHHNNAASSGRIVNLATNDVERVMNASLFVNFAFWSPAMSLAILVVGIIELGPAFAAGYALLLLVVLPLQMYLAHRFAYFRSKIASITDRRVTMISQVVYGVRVMKMSGWEYQFLKRIQAIRREEVKQIERANVLKAWNEAIYFATNVIVTVFIFLMHLALGGTLTPRNVFTAFSLVNVLAFEMTKILSFSVMVSSSILRDHVCHPVADCVPIRHHRNVSCHFEEYRNSLSIQNDLLGRSVSHCIHQTPTRQRLCLSKVLDVTGTMLERPTPGLCCLL